MTSVEDRSEVARVPCTPQPLQKKIDISEFRSVERSDGSNVLTAVRIRGVDRAPGHRKLTGRAREHVIASRQSHMTDGWRPATGRAAIDIEIRRSDAKSFARDPTDKRESRGEREHRQSPGLNRAGIPASPVGAATFPVNSHGILSTACRIGSCALL